MQKQHLTPDVNRVLFCRNLPYKATAEEVRDLFRRFGAVRQVRLGVEEETRGTAYVIFDDIFEAKAAQENLNNYHMHDRYIIVRYHKAKS